MNTPFQPWLHLSPAVRRACWWKGCALCATVVVGMFLAGGNFSLSSSPTTASQSGSIPRDDKPPKKKKISKSKAVTRASAAKSLPEPAAESTAESIAPGMMIRERNASAVGGAEEDPSQGEALGTISVDPADYPDGLPPHAFAPGLGPNGYTGGPGFAPGYAQGEVEDGEEHPYSLSGQNYATDESEMAQQSEEVCPVCGVYHPPLEEGPGGYHETEGGVGLRNWIDSPLRPRKKLVSKETFQFRRLRKWIDDPLRKENWLYRPWSLSLMTGALFGDYLSYDRIDQGSGFIGGFRWGWDFDEHWGLENRYGFSTLRLWQKDNPGANNDNQIFYGDLDLLYYPWGNNRWRPYFMVGFGVASFSYKGSSNEIENVTAMVLPFGLGLKYRIDDRLVLRMEFVDNFSFPGGPVDAMNNFSLTGGVELRLGGRRKSYYPWNASMSQW